MLQMANKKYIHMQPVCTVRDIPHTLVLSGNKERDINPTQCYSCKCVLHSIQGMQRTLFDTQQQLYWDIWRSSSTGTRGGAAPLGLMEEQLRWDSWRRSSTGTHGGVSVLRSRTVANLECLMAMMAAMKNVLSPISDTMITEMAATKP